MRERDGAATDAAPGEQDDGVARFPRGRLVRWVTVLVLGVLLFLAVLQDPLSATGR